MFMRWSLQLLFVLWYCSHWYTGVLVKTTRHVSGYILEQMPFNVNFLLRSQHSKYKVYISLKIYLL